MAASRSRRLVWPAQPNLPLYSLAGSSSFEQAAHLLRSDPTQLSRVVCESSNCGLPIRKLLRAGHMSLLSPVPALHGTRIRPGNVWWWCRVSVASRNGVSLFRNFVLVMSCGVPPGVKHWHGAAPTTAMTHLAVSGSLDGKNVEWMEKVSDEQFTAR